jgi:hypothetical protein
MKQDADAYGPAVEVRNKPWPRQREVGVMLGSYLAETGRRELRALDSIEHGICLIDEGAEDALLVEPGLEQIAAAWAVAADYLDQANQSGEPQTCHPWPPATPARQTP